MKIEINIEKKYFYILALIIVLASAAMIIAYTGGIPLNPDGTIPPQIGYHELRYVSNGSHSVDTNEDGIIDVAETALTGGGYWSQTLPDIYYNIGNVGIGTSSPGRKLVIKEASGDRDNVLVIDSGDATNVNISAVDFFHNGAAEWGIGKGTSNNFYIDEFGVGNRLTILQGGNVGIGTTSPSGRLHIGGTNQRMFLGTGGWFVINRGAGASQNIYFGETSDTGKYIFRSSGDLTIEGNVGIGTTSPGSYKLYVNGQTYFADDIVGTEGFSMDNDVTNVYDDATSNSPYSRVNADSFHTNGLGVGQIFIEGRAIDANTWIAIGSGLAGGQGAQDVKIGNDNEIYVDTSTNSVGIGTTSPDGKLDIHSGTIQLHTDSTNSIDFGDTTHAEEWMIEYDGGVNGDLNFRRYSGGWYSALFLDRSSGNVGIGTTSPSEKLDVVGSIVASGTICDSTGCIGSGGGGGGGLPSCADGQVLKYNFGSSSWECADESGGLAFGNWVDVTAAAAGGAAQGPATSDGFVIGLKTGEQGAIEIRTDGNNPPTTVRQKSHTVYFNRYTDASVPIKKGDYWRIIGADTVYWIPVVSGGGGGGDGSPINCVKTGWSPCGAAANTNLVCPSGFMNGIETVGCSEGLCGDVTRCEKTRIQCCDINL